jgi:hypothetical protein
MGLSAMLAPRFTMRIRIQHLDVPLAYDELIPVLGVEVVAGENCGLCTGIRQIEYYLRLNAFIRYSALRAASAYLLPALLCEPAGQLLHHDNQLPFLVWISLVELFEMKAPSSKHYVGLLEKIAALYRLVCVETILKQLNSHHCYCGEG